MTHFRRPFAASLLAGWFTVLTPFTGFAHPTAAHPHNSLGSCTAFAIAVREGVWQWCAKNERKTFDLCRDRHASWPEEAAGACRADRAQLRCSPSDYDAVQWHIHGWRRPGLKLLLNYVVRSCDPDTQGQAAASVPRLPPQAQSYQDDSSCGASGMNPAGCAEAPPALGVPSAGAWHSLCAGENEMQCSALGVSALYESCLREPACSASVGVLDAVLADCLSAPSFCTRSTFRSALQARGLPLSLPSAEPGHDLPDLSGVYSIVAGRTPLGFTYGGTVTISRKAGVGTEYCLKWVIPDPPQEEFGCGPLTVASGMGELILTVDWGVHYPVIYRVTRDGSFLKGTWDDGAGTEDLRRQ